ncbi:GSCOCG00000109001-RA-CDS, partial [Cotesia congregata]
QLRVIRAFRSTLEDLEERRSVHSLHSLHSMRSSRSHTGPRPLSDFTYIDDDASNFFVNASKGGIGGISSSGSGSRLPSINSPASPLLLNVPGSGSSYNSHHRHNNNRVSPNNTLDHHNNHSTTLSPNHATSRSFDSGAPNSPSSGSSDPILPPELPKMVHETSI